MLRFLCLLLALSMQLSAAPRHTSKNSNKNSKTASTVVPFSTKSGEAREALQRGVVKWENHRMAEAVDDYRNAAKADANFAVAHLFVSTLTPNPDEQRSELQKALALRGSANPDEQLLIDWLANTSQNQILPAIASMNELLGRYPNDTHLLYRAAMWFRNQRQMNRTVSLFEHLLQLNSQFADPYNQLGYIYAFQGEFDKAIADMKKYVAVLPNEPNPEDSYAEIFRMAGRYDEALAHYRRALEIEPSFWSSQFGIAGTYALMGDEPRARKEYALAIEHAPSEATALLWMMDSAVTWIREKKFAEASGVYREIAQRAHDHNLAEAESNAYRMMSLYEKGQAVRQQLLDQSEAALQHNHPLSNLAREQQVSLVLRTRIYADLDAGNIEAANKIMEQIRSVAEKTHNGFIQVVYHGAAGAVLTAQGKYEDAVSELLEDDRNPYSLKFLVVAYQKSGAGQEATHWAARLASVKYPTLEQTLVVVPAAAPPVTVSAGTAPLNEPEWMFFF